MQFIEEYRLVVGKRFGKEKDKFVGLGISQGIDATYGSVNFDYEKVYKYEDHKRFDLIGFWHSHPPGASHIPSLTDKQTMHAWTNAFDRPLLCAISHLDEVHGWWFTPGEELARMGYGCYKLNLYKFGPFFLGNCL